MKSPIIYKYQLPATLGAHTLLLPTGARFLSAQMQDNILTLWAMIDLEEKKQASYQLLILGTGIDLLPDFDKDWRFIDTAQDGYYVWHIFYKEV